MKQIQIFLIAMCIYCVAMTNISCTKWLEVEPPADQIIADQVFTSDLKAESAVSAVYAHIINGSGQHLSNKLLSLYAGYASDELSHYSPNSGVRAFLSNNLLPSTSLVGIMWRSAYETIYFSNVCIEGLSKSETISPGLRDRLIAEMKFTRAWQHFTLFQLYGEVPLILTTDYEANALAKRTDSSTFFKHIIDDLVEASTKLPDVFDNGERIRPTYWAAQALLARVYLHQKRWIDAESAATNVISDSKFSSLPAVDIVFKKESPEAIWQLKPQSSVLHITSDFVVTSTPKVILTNNLVGGFAHNDLRRNWIDSVVRNGTKYYYPAKYRNITLDITEYLVVMRAAEQVLIRCEARAMQGKLASAVSDLNMIRQRAGLDPISATVGIDDLLQEIFDQRFLELWAENGDRWLTLKRTNRALASLIPLKPEFREEDLFFPIPSSEIRNNPNMTQNPGY